MLCLKDRIELLSKKTSPVIIPMDHGVDESYFEVGEAKISTQHACTAMPLATCSAIHKLQDNYLRAIESREILNVSGKRGLSKIFDAAGENIGNFIKTELDLYTMMRRCNRMVLLQYNSEISSVDVLYVTVFIHKDIIITCDDLNDGLEILNYYLPHEIYQFINLVKGYNYSDHTHHNDLVDFFNKHKERRAAINFACCAINVQHKLLVPKLRNYQQRSVKWMYQRETQTIDTAYTYWLQNNFFPLNDETTDSPVFCNYPLIILMRESLEIVRSLLLCRGGLLAEEMGLGKTIEILALIMSHQRNMHNVKLDSVKGTLVIAPSSIILQWNREIEKHVRMIDGKSLNILIYEGNKRSRKQKADSKAHCDLTVSDLAQYDIVICSYEVLRKEILYEHAVAAISQRDLRKKKIYLPKPSPLTKVEWWRMCIDEAQCVESTASMAWQMCCRIRAVNRWCITGTPLSHSVEELMGLLSILHARPFHIDAFAKQLIFEYKHGDANLLIDPLAHFMCRTMKHDVRDELQIPTAHEHFVYMTLSPIECECLRQLQEHTRANLPKNVVNLLNQCLPTNTQPSTSTDNDLQDALLTDLLDRHTLKKIIGSLLELRKCVVHPELAKIVHAHGPHAPATQARTFSSIQEITAKLINDNKCKCEEELRNLIAAINGMAGVQRLKTNDVNDAIVLYERALDTKDQYERDHNIRVDRLPIIHTTHNLLRMIKEFNGTSKYDLDKLYKQKEQLAQEYMATAFVTFEQAIAAINDVNELYINTPALNHYLSRFSAAVTSLKNNQRVELEAFSSHNTKNKAIDMFNYWERELTNLFHDNGFTPPFTQLTGATYFLQSIETHRAKLRERLCNICHRLSREKLIDPQYAKKCVDCHIRLRPSDIIERNAPYWQRSTPLCDLCIVDRELLEARVLFVNFNSWKYITSNGELNKMKFMNNDEWQAFQKTIERYFMYCLIMDALKRRPIILDSEDNACVKHEKCEMEKIAETDQKLYQAANDYWTVAQELVSKTDELHMALSTYDLISNAEVIALGGHDNVPRNLLVRHELNWRATQLQMEELNSERLLNVELKRRVFLRNQHEKALNNQHSDNVMIVKESNVVADKCELSLSQKNDNDNQCPVCLTEVTHCVMECGHALCEACFLTIRKMNEQRQQHLICCPICRKNNATRNIFIVKQPLRIELSESTKDVSLNIAEESILFKEEAQMSTKLRVVMRYIGRISRNNKCIVFSHWAQVIHNIAINLANNCIGFVDASVTGVKFGKLIESWRNSDNKPVLLLPLANGSKGLNLIEATHILFIEPQMNISAEAQAIGRLHRIGQTRETHIYHFIVKDSIEEVVFNMRHNTGIVYDLNNGTDKPTAPSLDGFASQACVLPSYSTLSHLRKLLNYS